VTNTYFFAVAISFLSGLFLSYYSLPVIFLFYVSLIFILFLPQNKLKITALLILLFSFLFGCLYFERAKTKDELPSRGEFYGEVLKVEPYFYGNKVWFRLSSGEEIIFIAHHGIFYPGMNCLLTLTSKEVKEGLNPFRPTTKELARAQGVADLYEFKPRDRAVCKESEVAIESIRYELFRFSDKLSGLAKGLFQALVLNVENQLPSEYLETLKKQGLYHQLAISGFNLGILYGILYKAFLFLLKRFPFLFKHYPLQVYAMILSLPGALVVLFLSGFAGSALRAFFFLLLFVFSKIFFRQTSSIFILLLTAFILCLFDPYLIGNLSFQFSFLATLGLLLGNLYWQKIGLSPANLWQKILYLNLQGFFISTLISLILLPLMLYRIGYFSVATPVNNLIASFFWSFIFILLSLLSALIYFVNDDLAKILIEVVGVIFKWYMKIPLFDWIYIPSLSVNLLTLYFLVLPFFFFLIQKLVIKESSKKILSLKPFAKILSLLFVFTFLILLYNVFNFFYKKTDFVIVFKDKNFPHILVKNQDKYSLLVNLTAKDIDVFKAKYFPVYYKLGVKRFECVFNFSPFNPYSIFSRDFEVKKVSTVEEIRYLENEVCDPRMFELIPLDEQAYILEIKGLTLLLGFSSKVSLVIPAELSIFYNKPKNREILPFDDVYVESERQSAIIILPKDGYALVFSERERRASELAYFLFPFVPYYFEGSFAKKIVFHRINLP